MTNRLSPFAAAAGHKSSSVWPPHGTMLDDASTLLSIPSSEPREFRIAAALQVANDLWPSGFGVHLGVYTAD